MSVLFGKTIALIGAGHMGSAIVGGLIAAGHPPTAIYATCKTQEHAEALSQRFSAIMASVNNHHAIAKADAVIFAVKPTALPAVLEELAADIQQHQPLLISVAAGILDATMRAKLSGNSAIVRAMPNTPALLRCSATAHYANQFESDDQKALVQEIFSAIGQTVWIEDENKMDVVAALSGSGPDYFFFLIEAMHEAAMQLGLPEDVAYALTAQTALGSARMVLEGKEGVRHLRHQITSPGGGTEQALAVLESGEFKDLLLNALAAAKKRYEEMAAS